MSLKTERVESVTFWILLSHSDVLCVQKERKLLQVKRLDLDAAKTRLKKARVGDARAVVSQHTHVTNNAWPFFFYLDFLGIDIIYNILFRRRESVTPRYSTKKKKNIWPPKQRKHRHMSHFPFPKRVPSLVFFLHCNFSVFNSSPFEFSNGSHSSFSSKLRRWKRSFFFFFRCVLRKCCVSSFPWAVWVNGVKAVCVWVCVRESLFSAFPPHAPLFTPDQECAVMSCVLSVSAVAL